MTVFSKLGALTFPIHTERLILRRLRTDDLDDMFPYLGDAGVNHYIREPYTLDQARTFLAEKSAPLRGTDGEWLSLGLTFPGEDRVRGDVVLKLSSILNQHGELGFRLAPDLQGKGYAHEAADAMVRLAFEGLGLHKLTALCQARNQASVALLTRLGFVQEGLLRRHDLSQGQWVDVMVLGMFPDEWRPR